MPRPTYRDLDRFQLWLQDGRFLSPRTTSGYASRVRRIIKECDAPATPENLLRIFSGLEKRATHHNFATSWNAYVEFRKGEGEIIAGAPPWRKETSRKKREEIPDRILRGILELSEMSGMKLSDLVGVKWKHVKPNETDTTWMIQDPKLPSDYFRAPRYLVFTLFDWSSGGVSPESETPLIPRKTGSEEPIPERRLRGEINAFRKRR
jgi:integrase